MKQETNSFKNWMDKHDLKASDVNNGLFVSVQTVHHWRSRGVPDRNKAQVESFMSSYFEDIKNEPIDKQNLILHYDDEDFELLERAALRKHTTVKKWATDGLKMLAELELNNKDIALVAEEMQKYQSNQKAS